METSFILKALDSHEENMNISVESNQVIWGAEIKFEGQIFSSDTFQQYFSVNPRKS